MRPSLPIFALLLITACGAEKPAPAVDSIAAKAEKPLPAGEARLAVDGGRIWYKVSGSGAGTPVILLHGGPGFSSFYLKPLEALNDERIVVRYDQLGGGKSDTLTDTTKATIAHFVAELDSLRAHLGYDKVHLVGHSWGTILGLEYYRAHPEHVASLTLSSAALDVPQWERHANALVKTLTPGSQAAIRQADADGKFDAPGYRAAIDEFYGKYVWLHPKQPDLDSTFATVNETIYNFMQGPSEFTITGTLKHYNATSFLKQVKVPVLFTVGEFDEADPKTIARHAALTPKAEFAVIPGAAHMTPWDNPKANVDVVRSFLRKVDSTAAKRP